MNHCLYTPISYVWGMVALGEGTIMMSDKNSSIFIQPFLEWQQMNNKWTTNEQQQQQQHKLIQKERRSCTTSNFILLNNNVTHIY